MPDLDVPRVGRGLDQVPAQPVFPVDGSGNPLAGAGSTPTAANATDANLTQTSGNTDATTAGVWTQVLAANLNRLGARIQNDSAGALFIRQADTQPTAGAKAGDIRIPAPAGNSFVFDLRPLKAYWIRGDATNLAYSVQQW